MKTNMPLSEPGISVIRYVIDDLDVELSRRFSKRRVLLGKQYLPYCLHPVSHSNPSRLIWVNRNYQPVGCCGYGRYEEFPYLHIDRDDPRICSLIEACTKVIGGNFDQPIFFLFDDIHAPWRSRAMLARYRNRLALVDY